MKMLLMIKALIFMLLSAVVERATCANLPFPAYFFVSSFFNPLFDKTILEVLPPPCHYLKFYVCLYGGIVYCLQQILDEKQSLPYQTLDKCMKFYKKQCLEFSFFLSKNKILHSKKTKSNQNTPKAAYRPTTT